MPATTTATRKPFRRTVIPRVERAASGAVLAVLAAVAFAVWRSGQNYDPGRYAPRLEDLKSTITAIDGKAATLKADMGSHLGSAAPAAAVQAEDAETEGYEAAKAPAASKPLPNEPLQPALKGIKPLSETEFYNPDNLYEKINGRAPAYIGFNCLGLRCRSFEVAGSPGSFVDVFEYLHDTPVNAFGMFALERDADGRALPFVADGYASGTGFYFRQGSRYVQVIASDEKPAGLALARAIAEERAKALPSSDQGLEARRRLPGKGLVADSITYVKENAQGQAFLKDVFQANYDFGGKKIQFFVMVAKPDEAAAAWGAFRAFCERFGKVTELPSINGAQIFQAETFGSFKIIYRKDGEVGGGYDATDAVAARQFVENYLKGEIQ